MQQILWLWCYIISLMSGWCSLWHHFLFHFMPELQWGDRPPYRVITSFHFSITYIRASQRIYWQCESWHTHTHTRVVGFKMPRLQAPIANLCLFFFPFVQTPTSSLSSSAEMKPSWEADWLLHNADSSEVGSVNTKASIYRTRGTWIIMLPPTRLAHF